MNDQAPVAYAPLWRTAWRRLRQRPFQYILLVLGIALGVAMIVAIDVSSNSAQRAFDLSAAAITGKSTHRLVSGPAGVDQQLYVDLRRHGYDFSAPVIEGYVLARGLGNRAMQFMGTDPFAESAFRSPLWSNQNIAELGGFLTRPNGVVLSRQVAQKYGLAVGDRIALQVKGAPTTVTLVGLLTPADEVSNQKLSDLIIADISTAQELFHMPGRLSHIDLIIKDEATATRIQQRLPAGVRMETSDTQRDTVKQMTDAFTVNLTALSLIALLVGIFLIYNTVTFNVVQRRPFFAILRCLGVTREQLFWLIMTESLVAGLIGTGLGLLIGIWLGEGLIGLVTQTINDFYFVINVRNVSVSAESLLKGLIIGIFAAMLATLPPAIEAMRTVPASTLRRSSLESKITKLMPWLWVAWFGLGSFGVLMLWLPGNNLVVAFVGLFSVLIALALIAPPLTRFVMLRLAPGLGRLLGPIGRMAPRNIVRSLSRTSIAIAALMMAVSLMVGVSISVGSFRQTLANWLEVTLKSDVYVSPPTLTSGRPSGNLPVDAVRNISKWPGVRDAVMARYSSVFAPDWGREVELMAVSGDISDGKRPYRWIDGNKDTLWPRFLAGKGVMLSEPMVSRQHLQMPPRPITLMTDSGPQTFPVLAVFSDYTSDQGVILMDRASYRAHWQDDDVTTMFLFLASGANSGALIDQLQAAFAGREDIVIQSTHSVREASMFIFDRSFTITIALQLVATVVAFIGVLSALMSLELDRAHELGVFRAIGMTTRQLWKLMFIETGLMGGMAGVAFWWWQRPRTNAVAADSLVGVLVDENNAGYSLATVPGAVRFPRDLGPHYDYQTEWWYYTGNLETADGRLFGYQLTFFRRALAPPGEGVAIADASSWRTTQVYMAHFAISDISNRGFYPAEKFSRQALGLAGASSEPYAVWLDDWYARESNNNSVQLFARTQNTVLDLTLTQTLPPILQGNAGLSVKGAQPGNASNYYSLVRQESRGTVSVNGDTFMVSGLSWKDHEYMTSALAPEDVGWDWFGLQFYNGTALMLFQIRQADGSVTRFSSGTFVAGDGGVIPLESSDFRIKTTDRWTSDQSGATYPIAWEIEIERIGLTLRGAALMANQELRLSRTYWEGAVALEGRYQGMPISGRGYVEMTGYVQRLS